MKTDRLIAMLATDGSVANHPAPSRRFGIAVLGGIAAAVVLMALGLGIRPDIVTVVHTTMFWIRVGFAVAMLGTALLAATRLARPGVPAAPGLAAIAMPVALIWSLAAFVLVQAPEGSRLALLLGHTWRVCPPLIAALSVPAFVAMFWAMRGMAPVRLRLAGAVAGLAAGASAVIAYCLHCPEMAPPFWALWYLSGMLIPAAVGSLLGPRFLRW